MNPNVDLYLKDGCGRCELYRSPDCKVHAWTKELNLLRSIILETGLIEDYKWSQPCYTYNSKNILILTVLKDFCSISFLKGALLNDPENLLVSPGKNSQSAKYFKFRDTKTIKKLEKTIKAYIFEAIEIEKAGLKVEFKKNPESIPSELKEKFRKDPELKMAFENLTPGRQRSYVVHISSAKQSKTREARIEKCVDKIFSGKGFNEY